MNTRTFLKSLATIAVAPHIIPKAMCAPARMGAPNIHAFTNDGYWILDPSYSGTALPRIMLQCPHCMDLFAESHGYKKIILHERKTA